jgi:His/Glu/Gln/Arg/opine family amino acid ABC transporter permease subunit
MEALWGAFLDFLPGNWENFKIWGIWRFLLEGLWVSVQIAIVAIILSIIVGVVMSIARLAPVPIVRILATTYIETFRATPLLLLIFFVFFGAGRFNTSWATDIPLLNWFVDDRSRWRSTTAQSLRRSCGPASCRYPKALSKPAGRWA